MKKKSRFKWFIGFVILGIATLINFVIPDFIPVIDEVLMTAGTLYLGYKTISK